MDTNTILLAIIAGASVATAIGTAVTAGKTSGGSDPKDPIKRTGDDETTNDGE